MFPAPDKRAQSAIIDDNRPAIDETAALHADCLSWLLAVFRRDRGTLPQRVLWSQTASLLCCHTRALATGRSQPSLYTRYVSPVGLA
jgi:hypothetical protein